MVQSRQSLFALNYWCVYFLFEDEPRIARIRTAKARMMATFGLLAIAGISLDRLTGVVEGVDAIA